jgi:hypothetical protein
MSHLVDLMDRTPTLNGSVYRKELNTLLSTTAVSAARPRGLLDLGLGLSSAEWALQYPLALGGFTLTPLVPLSPDATSVQRHNHSLATADQLVVISGIQTVKTFALSMAGSTIRAALDHHESGFTNTSIVHVTDYVVRHYWALSRTDIVALENTLKSYDDALSMEANFARYKSAHAMLSSRGQALTDQRKMDFLYVALQTHVTQLHRLKLYMAQHPDRLDQSYESIQIYLSALDRSMADITPAVLGISSLPSAVPPVADNSFAFAALQKSIDKLTVALAKPSPAASTVSTAVCNKCKDSSPTVHTLWKKCKTHNKYAK